MRLRIVRPLPEVIEGLNVAHLKFGASYDVSPPLSDLLLVAGYGLPDDKSQIDPGTAVNAFAAAFVAREPVLEKPDAEPLKKTPRKAAAGRRRH
jgi:hypothetical protein